MKKGVVVAATPAAPSVIRGPDAHSKYQILYWQDLPTQVKAWDDFDEVKLDLPHRFA